MQTLENGFRRGLVMLAGIAAMACTKPAPAGDKGVLPLVERRVYVELPTQANVLSAAAKGEYDYGRRTVSNTRPRCVDAPVKGECQRVVDVQVTAVEGAKYIESGKPPDKPQLIAWIENLSLTDSTHDGLLTRDKARYALVVNSVAQQTEFAGARPQLVLVEFPPARYRMTPRSISTRIRPWGHVYECHNYRQPYLSEVDFRPCDKTVGATPPETRRNTTAWMTTLATSSASFYVDDPIWFTCSSGCCSSRYAN